MEDSKKTGRTLAQTLAVRSQLHLPGSVGRIVKQIRDVERAAPVFKQAGLIRAVKLPKPLDLRVAGIATGDASTTILGGQLFAAAATRLDLSIDHNAISTVGYDSVCEIDDINYENKHRRLQLIGVRQAYAMAESALLSGNRYDLIVMDSPLVLNRSMVPPRHDENYAGYRDAYDETHDVIVKFWEKYQSELFPFNENGTMLAGLSGERYGAIVYISRQDLRTDEGRQHILDSEEIDVEQLRSLLDSMEAIRNVGERRFVVGVLGNYTRTAAFRMNVQTPRMEPNELVSRGVVGFHYKAAYNTEPKLVQLIGNSPGWTQTALDRLAGWLMTLTLSSGTNTAPLPIQLAERELKALPLFVEDYRRKVKQQMEAKDIEKTWLSDFGDLD